MGEIANAEFSTAYRPEIECAIAESGERPEFHNQIGRYGGRNDEAH